MAIQTVKTGAAVNDGTGDDARTAFTKINQNFTTNSHAASRLVGTQAGNVMEVGAFGVGADFPLRTGSSTSNENLAVFDFKNGEIFYYSDIDASGVSYGPSSWKGQIAVSPNGVIYARGTVAGGAFQSTWHIAKTTKNTTIDGNGFIKAASPIVKLLADKIELNDEAQQQNIEFEKLGVGDYLIKGSSGFAQEGWYVEAPKDANGNVLVAVIYEQLANNDISVKTYDYMLNKKGRIVPDLETPLDIPAARWIDIRLQELPQTDVSPADETVATDA